MTPSLAIITNLTHRKILPSSQSKLAVILSQSLTRRILRPLQRRHSPFLEGGSAYGTPCGVEIEGLSYKLRRVAVVKSKQNGGSVHLQPLGHVLPDNRNSLRLPTISTRLEWSRLFMRDGMNRTTSRDQAKIVKKSSFWKIKDSEYIKLILNLMFIP